MIKITKRLQAKQTILLSVLLLLSSISVAFVAAEGEFWACFGNGDSIDYCNPAIPDAVCTSTICKRCMSAYNEISNCYSPGSFNVCTFNANPECSQGQSGGIDSSPPILTLTSPVNGSILTDRSIMFSFSMNEIADVYFLDLINGRGRWAKFCSDCRSYAKKRSFKDGLNQLQIRVTDESGNEAFKEISFFIDSKFPQITKTTPKKGYANGQFTVEFKEENPQTIILHIGNFFQGYQTNSVNLNSCSPIQGGKFSCVVEANITRYNGQSIEYWFTLTDIANNQRESKHTPILVDTVSPVFNALTTMLQEDTLLFDVQTSELVTLEYYDLGEARPAWRKLCSKCSMYMKSKSFRLGYHELTLRATDPAGNSIEQALPIFTI